ncbi:DUF4380 domain-containing protein [Microbulbifer sp. TYP-18]|uniref:DUF4380 domain-containing protein n=1 Tax=Microbulbifer sp. TYP-18 TaxID=3230024 RepID=UPI0034C66A48
MPRLSRSLRLYSAATALCCAAAAAGTEISLRSGDLSVRIDPATGARISELRLKDQQLLSGPEVHPDNYGSTFWLSPQALWSWPPVPEHDNQPYEVLQQGGNSVTLLSAPGAGAQVRKNLRTLGHNLLQLDYRIQAQSGFEQVAAWEVTRVARAGLAFAPVTPASVQQVRGQVDYLLDKEGILWLPMAPSEPLREGKVIANGTAGWLAYAAQGQLYLKIYPPVAQHRMASGEGDIELYLSGHSPYLELEIQSAAQALAPAQHLDWRVHWLVTEIPDEVAVEPASPSLLRLVRQQLQRARALIHGGSVAEAAPDPNSK